MRTVTHTAPHIRRLRRAASKSPRSGFTLPALVAAAGATATPGALCQQADTGPTLEQIVVTAQRYQQDLQKVPLAVSAFDGRRLRQLHIESVADIGQYVPNMISNIGTRGDASSSGAIYIRGVGQSDSYPNADQGVGIYIDGVYLSRWKGALAETYDIDRVEVLRGPQGTLYGKNTIGGAVNLITNEPQASFDYRLGAGYGSFNAYQTDAMINVPITDSLWFRAAIHTNNDDGYEQNLFNGGRAGGQAYAGGRLMLRLHPSDDLDVNLTTEIDRNRPVEAQPRLTAVNPDGALFGTILPELGALAAAAVIPPLPVSVTNLSSLGSYVLPPGADPAKGGSFNTIGRGRLDVYTGILTIEKDLVPGVKLKSITSYRTYSSLEIGDLDGSPLMLLGGTTAQHQWQASQELQIIASAFDGRLTSVSGLYWFKEHATNDELLIAAPDLFSILYDLGVPDLGRGYQLSLLDARAQNYSAYSQQTWAFTSRWRAIAGLRWTHETRTMSNLTAFPMSETPSQLVAPPARAYRAWTPRIGVEFQATPAVMLYANAAKGFKSGMVSFQGADSEGRVNPVNPEFVWSYEAGTKSRWLGDRLQANADVFYSDYTDMQLVTYVADPVTQLPLSQVRNAGKATMKGAELELIAKPTARLELNGSLGLLSTKYDRFMDIDPATLLPVDRSHNQMPFAPRATAAVSARYTEPLSNGASITGQVGWTYRSESQLLTINTPYSVSNAYGLGSARLVYTTSSGRASITLWGDNLTDKVYKTYALDLTDGTFGTAIGGFGAPRSYGIRLDYRFR